MKHWIEGFAANEGKPIVRNAWVVDGMTFATDGRMLISVDEVVEGIPVADKEVARPILDLLKRTNRAGGCRVVLADLRAWTGTFEDCKKAPCDKCHGNRTHPCSECGQEVECLDCEGGGEVTKNPAARPAKFFDVCINRNLLAKVLPHLPGEEAKVSTAGEDDPIRIEAAGHTVLIMPMKRTNENKLGPAFPGLAKGRRAEGARKTS